MSAQELTSLKELASQLKVSDALLKKIIKDFDIPTERAQKKVFLTSQSVSILRDILALRASGKKNNEIKDLFDASKAEQEAKDTPIPSLEETKTETITEKAIIPAEDTELVVEANSEITNAENSSTEVNSRKTNHNKRFDKFKNRNRNKEETRSKQQEESESDKAENSDELDYSSYLVEDESSSSMAMELAETGDDELEENNSINIDDDDDDEAEVEEVERIEERLSPRRIRRRQFSFRYIQRQIANDSKRVNYLKQKLKRGRLAEPERLSLEQSLEQRSMLLSGWTQLLRWVKS